MNDQFIPANRNVPQTPEVLPPQPAQPPMDPSTKATYKLAEMMADQTILNHMKASALWQQAILVVKEIENDGAYENAINTFTKVKAAIKSWEDLRHTYVDYPTKFVQMANDTFRPVRLSFEKAKDHLSKLLSDYDLKKRIAAAEEQKRIDAEAAKNASPAPPEEKQIEGGTSEVQMGAPVVAPPLTVIKTEEGGKVQMREVLVVDVVDLPKLLKAITSTSKRNEVYTTDLVEVKMPALRKLCTGKRKVPGVEWKIENKAV
jgi:hypothetical protein